MNRNSMCREFETTYMIETQNRDVSTLDITVETETNDEDCSWEDVYGLYGCLNQFEE